MAGGQVALGLVSGTQEMKIKLLPPATRREETSVREWQPLGENEYPTTVSHRDAESPKNPLLLPRGIPWPPWRLGER